MLHTFYKLISFSVHPPYCDREISNRIEKNFSVKGKLPGAMTRDVFKVISHSGSAATKRRGRGGQFSANLKNLEGTWIYSALAMFWIRNDTLAHFGKKKDHGKSLHASGEKADRIRVIGSDFIVWFSTALICKLRGFFFNLQMNFKMHIKVLSTYLF